MYRPLLIAIALIAPIAPVASGQLEPAQSGQPPPPATMPAPGSGKSESQQPAEQMDCTTVEKKDTARMSADERKRMLENCRETDRSVGPRGSKLNKPKAPDRSS
jgi:hypothetical protein